MLMIIIVLMILMKNIVLCNIKLSNIIEIWIMWTEYDIIINLKLWVIHVQ